MSTSLTTIGPSRTNVVFDVVARRFFVYVGTNAA
jgi:hypothetical protein